MIIRFNKKDIHPSYNSYAFDVIIFKGIQLFIERDGNALVISEIGGEKRKTIMFVDENTARKYQELFDLYMCYDEVTNPEKFL